MVQGPTTSQFGNSFINPITGQRDGGGQFGGNVEVGQGGFNPMPRPQGPSLGGIFQPPAQRDNEDGGMNPGVQRYLNSF
jgi:hypothetical protein